jgi:phosphate transport system protein
MRDIPRAEGVLVRDDVEDRYVQILSGMAAPTRKRPEDAKAALRIIRVAHCLERFAGHATNIAEETIFAVRGDDIRHATQRCRRSWGLTPRESGAADLSVLRRGRLEFVPS